MPGFPAILAQRFPTVAARLVGADDGGSPMKVERQLAVLWAQSQIKTPKPNVMYIVSGFGEHVATLLPRMDATACLVIYEASLKNLKSSLSSKDWAALLNDPRVFLFAGAATAGDFEQLHQMPVARIDQIVPVRFSPAWQLDEKAYADFFSEIAKQFEVARRLHLTGFNDGIFWQSTTFANLPRHCRAPDVKTLKNLFPDIPIVLAGAGPSLDEAEDFLKNIAQRAVIIAVNSSYQKLRKIGVKPHLVLAADPRGDTYRGFEGQITDDGTYLVAPFIVNSKVVKAFTGRGFSWSGENNALIALLRKRLGLGEGTAVLEKGTVSLSAADLAALMGARQLILVGQDMSIDASGLTHTRDSFYAGAKVKEEQLGEMKRVPGNTTDEVITPNNLYVYLKGFEQWVEAHPRMEVINTARLGAKISGAAYVPYETVLQKIRASPVNVWGRLQTAFERAPERELPPAAWFEALAPTREFARRLYTQALSAATAMEALPEKFYQSIYQESKEIKELYAMALGINTLIDENPEDYRVVLEGRLKKSLLDFQAMTGTLETNNPFGLQLRKNKEFFWALVEGTEPISAFLQGTVKKEG